MSDPTVEYLEWLNILTDDEFWTWLDHEPSAGFGQMEYSSFYRSEMVKNQKQEVAVTTQFKIGDFVRRKGESTILGKIIKANTATDPTCTVQETGTKKGLVTVPAVNLEVAFRAVEDKPAPKFCEGDLVMRKSNEKITGIVVFPNAQSDMVGIWFDNGTSGTSWVSARELDFLGKEKESETLLSLSIEEIEPFLDSVQRSIDFATVRLAALRDSGSAVNLQKWFARTRRALINAVSDLNSIHKTACIIASMPQHEVSKVVKTKRTYTYTVDNTRELVVDGKTKETETGTEK